MNSSMIVENVQLMQLLVVPCTYFSERTHRWQLLMYCTSVNLLIRKQ